MTIRFALSFVLAMAAASSVAAQDDLTFSRRNTAAYFNYAEQGDITVQASVWGAVRYPGYYEVPVGTKLSELLSIAGGPATGERLRRSKRTVTIQLFRDTGGLRQVIYEQQATNGVSATGRDIQIMDGDLLGVESVVRQGFSFRDMFSVVAAFASVALAVERIVSIGK